MAHILKRIVLFLLLFYSCVSVKSQYTRSDSLTYHDLKNNGVLFSNNNTVTLLESGRVKYDDMLRAIEQGRQYIYVEYFNLRNDSIGNVLFKMLGKKASQGVKVRVLCDYWGNISNDRPLRKKQLQELRNEGIDIHLFDPIVFPWINHALHRDHRKIVIIDGKTVYTGGMNVADYYIHGNPEYGEWRDMHIRIEGDAVKDYRDIFCEMWQCATEDTIPVTEYTLNHDLSAIPFYGLKCDSVQSDGQVLLGVADRVTRVSPTIIRKGYIDAIDNAENLIQIVNPYFTLVKSVRKAFYRALKRGVKIEIMLSTKCDIPVTPDVSAYNAKKLMKRGADIYYYEDGFHHSKVMMVDSLFCTVGSANLNSRSLSFDYEVNAFIMDTLTTYRLQDIFEVDKQSSTLLTPENWKERRSFKRRFMGWFYHFLAPLI